MLGLRETAFRAGLYILAVAKASKSSLSAYECENRFFRVRTVATGRVNWWTERCEAALGLYMLGLRETAIRAGLYILVVAKTSESSFFAYECENRFFRLRTFATGRVNWWTERCEAALGLYMLGL